MASDSEGQSLDLYTGRFAMFLYKAGLLHHS